MTEQPGPSTEYRTGDSLQNISLEARYAKAVSPDDVALQGCTSVVHALLDT